MTTTDAPAKELTDFTSLDLAVRIANFLDGVPMIAAMEAIDSAKAWILSAQTVSLEAMLKIEAEELRRESALQARGSG